MLIILPFFYYYAGVMCVSMSPAVSGLLNRSKRRDGRTLMIRGQELCESRGGRPGLRIPNGPYGLCARKVTLKLKHQVSELRSCVKVEVAVLGSPSLMVLTVSVDVKRQ